MQMYSSPVSYTLAETIGWILFDMDEQYALFLSQPLSSVLWIFFTAVQEAWEELIANFSSLQVCSVWQMFLKPRKAKGQDRNAVLMLTNTHLVIGGAWRGLNRCQIHVTVERVEQAGISWLLFGSIPSVLLLGFIQVPDFFCLQLTWPRIYIACINRHFRCWHFFATPCAISVDSSAVVKYVKWQNPFLSFKKNPPFIAWTHLQRWVYASFTCDVHYLLWFS